MLEIIDMHRTITFLNGAGHTAPSIRAGTVRLEADYTVLDPRLAQYCSLVGRVAQVGQEVDNLQAGDCVIALGAPAASLVLPADNCLKLPKEASITAESAYFALSIALLSPLRHGQLEVGETVLVLGNGLVGQMLSQLALAAGAIFCAGFDPDYVNNAGTGVQTERRFKPVWFAEEQALETVLPKTGADLLIDASGDPALLSSNLARVANAGRVLLVNRYSPSALDFDVYPDLHKRSIKIVSSHMAGSLREAGSNHSAGLSSAKRNLEFVYYLYQSGRLRPSCWPTTRIQAPDAETVTRAVQATKNRALFIEW